MHLVYPGEVTTFIKANPDRYAAVFVLVDTRASFSSQELQSAYDLLSPRVKATTTGVKIKNYLAGLENSKIGRRVNDFTLPTPEEKTIQFASLKGKYTLIDFWASLCGPCKMSFPHMKEVYAKYKGDKFEIYSISIDKDKKAWLAEAQKQQLPWLSALDDKSISVKEFGVSAVPTTYLIDPDGKIVMKEVGFDPKGNGAIEKKLNEVLK